MPKVPIVRSVWFLPITRDLQDISSIRLGSIIESAWRPEEVISDDESPTIEPGLIRRREDTSWSWTREVEQSAGGGIFASFLQLLGIGGEVGSTVDKTHTEVFTVERMVTEEFSPDKGYLENCFQDLGVRDTFIGPGRKSKAYMVTGLKTAYGAAKATETMKKKNWHARLGIDASAAMIPVSLGPGGHWSSGVTERSSADESNFIFAFKLRRLRYKKGELTHERYDRGAQFGLGGGGSEESKTEELDVKDFDIETVEGVRSEEFRMKSRDIMSLEDSNEVTRVYYPVSL